MAERRKSPRGTAAQGERVRLIALRADVSTALASIHPTPAVLQQCCEALVRHLDMAFARIWTLNGPEQMLELRASAGFYTHLDGPHGRVPVGQFKIGRIAGTGQPHLTNAVPDDPNVSDREWARREGMAAFAGYPLTIEGRVVGVVAMFARHPLTEGVLTDLAPLAEGIAQFIDRRRSEERLREQAELYRVTLASIGDAVLTTDAEGRVTFLNDVAVALTGWTRDEAAGQPVEAVFDIVNEGTGKTVESPVARALREGGIVGLANHAVLISRDGTRRPIDDSGAPIRSGDRIVGAVLVFRDISERKQAAERERQAVAEAIAAAEANAKFRTFFEQGTYFAGVMTLDGTIVEANRLCLDACGFTRDEIIGKKFWDCGWWNRSPALMEMVRAGCLQAIAGRPFRRETPYFVADGSERVVDLTISPVTDDAGRVLFVAPTGVDVTDRKRAENDLRRLAADLSEADHRKDEFLATLAHELRNPLAPIRNGLEILKRADHGGAAVERARTMMDRQLSQLVRLVDDLLDVSRITRNKLELRRERIELSAVVSSAVETSRPLIEAGGHDLTVSVPPAPVHLDADLTRLAQVFSNLLNNAAKYTEKGGRIRLAARRQGGDVLVSVQDTGVGIPPGMLPQVFEAFTQIDRSLERSQGGLGIGLTLVKRLVEMHGGSVTAHSEGLGRGSEFVVCLPVLAEKPEPGPTPVKPAAEAVLAMARRVLVVDDNRDSALSLAMLLRLTGCETWTAHDGVEAVETAAAYKPDVILLDIGMPRMNGYEACRTIREQPWGKSIMMVALTGWGQDEDRRLSREAGFDSHLVKPVDHAALMRLLAGSQSVKV